MPVFMKTEWFVFVFLIFLISHRIISFLIRDKLLVNEEELFLRFLVCHSFKELVRYSRAFNRTIRFADNRKEHR